MIRFALIMVLASCSMLTVRGTAETEQPGQIEPAPQTVETETEAEPKPKPVKADTAKPKAKPLPPTCDMETEDSRKEMLNKLDCLLNIVK